MKYEYSWSLRRHNIFKKCNRAYYYTYYCSRNGWEYSSKSEEKAAYSRKKFKSHNDLFIIFFLHAIKKTIIFDSFNPKEIKKYYYQQIAQLMRSSKKHLPNLQEEKYICKEVIQGKINADELYDKSRNFINATVSRLFESRLGKSLSQINALAVISGKKESYFHYNGIKIWTFPDLIYREKSRIKILNFRFTDSEYSRYWHFRAGLNKLYIENAMPFLSNLFIDSETHFFKSDNLNTTVYSMSKGELIGIIDNSIGEMLNITSLDTKIEKNIFKKNNNKRICSNCEFNDICN